MRLTLVLLACLAVALPMLAGCAEPSGTYRFGGRLDRALTDAERAELVDMAGKEPEVVATAMACPGTVDPYDCNHHALTVDGLSRGLCEELVGALAARPYWRGEPSCEDMAGRA